MSYKRKTKQYRKNLECAAIPKRMGCVAYRKEKRQKSKDRAITIGSNYDQSRRHGVGAVLDD